MYVCIYVAYTHNILQCKSSLLEYNERDSNLNLSQRQINIYLCVCVFLVSFFTAAAWIFLWTDLSTCKQLKLEYNVINVIHSLLCDIHINLLSKKSVCWGSTLPLYLILASKLDALLFGKDNSAVEINLTFILTRSHRSLSGKRSIVSTWL